MRNLVHLLHQVVSRYSVSLNGWGRKNPYFTLKKILSARKSDKISFCGCFINIKTNVKFDKFYILDIL